MAIEKIKEDTAGDTTLIGNSSHDELLNENRKSHPSLPQDCSLQ